MSFYSDASLVMIPSGYKTSKVYSAVPTDGAGDLSFTRTADTATRVGPDGLIEKVRTNEVRNSTMVGASAPSTLPTNWTLTTGGLTFSVIGTGTEDGLTYVEINASGTASSSNARIGFDSATQILGATGQYWTNSFYFKKVSETAAPDSYAMAIFENTSAGSLVVTNVASFSATTSLARYSYTALTNGGATVARVQPFFRVSLTSGNSYDFTFRIAAPQMEQGDIATQFIPTSTAAVSVGPVANVPRLDYLNSSCPRLLLEPQRTNLALFSEQFDNAGWTKNNSPTITTNIATAPDGYSGADGIQSTDAVNYKTITQNLSVSANSTLTLSFFVKKETSETAFGGFTMYFKGGTDKVVYGIVNAVSGTVTYASSTLTATTKVEDYGNYWRIASTATDTGSNTICAIGYYGTLSANGTSLSPAAGSVRTLWGFQAELGAYATSYIPTLGAAVTRGADAASKTGISSLIGQTEGTIYLEADIQKYAETGFSIAISDGATLANAIYLNRVASGNLQVLVRKSGNPDGAIIISSANWTAGLNKVAIAYTATTAEVFVNGSIKGTVSFISAPTCSQFAIGSRPDSVGTSVGTGPYSQALLFKTRLSNADLAALTA